MSDCHFHVVILIEFLVWKLLTDWWGSSLLSCLPSICFFKKSEIDGVQRRSRYPVIKWVLIFIQESITLYTHSSCHTVLSLVHQVPKPISCSGQTPHHTSNTSDYFTHEVKFPFWSPHLLKSAYSCLTNSSDSVAFGQDIFQLLTIQL